MNSALKLIGIYLLCFAYIFALAGAVVWTRSSDDDTVAAADAGEDITAEVMNAGRGQ